MRKLRAVARYLTRIEESAITEQFYRFQRQLTGLYQRFERQSRRWLCSTLKNFGCDAWHNLEAVTLDKIKLVG